MTERPSLGLSPYSRADFSPGRFDRMRRFGYLLVALLVVGVAFSYLTREVQRSTAHATSDDSNLHYDPNQAP